MFWLLVLFQNNQLK
uniref:Uncharacterized protein n=1 Tax=Anguilla anguilla TaxID=7936 RepID=A0A0E9SYR9_ANGAN